MNFKPQMKLKLRMFMFAQNLAMAINNSTPGIIARSFDSQNNNLLPKTKISLEIYLAHFKISQILTCLVQRQRNNFCIN